jgi:hypothetical protein
LLSSVLNIMCPPERARYSVQTPAPCDLILSDAGRVEPALHKKKETAFARGLSKKISK